MLMLPYRMGREDGRSCSNASELNGAKAAEGNEDRHRPLKGGNANCAERPSSSLRLTQCERFALLTNSRRSSADGVAVDLPYRHISGAERLPRSVPGQIRNGFAFARAIRGPALIFHPTA